MIDSAGASTATALQEPTTEDDASTEEAVKSTPAWKVWEADVAAHLETIDDLTATISANQHIEGQASKAKRQIDVLVEKTTAGAINRVIIECKAYKRKLDVGKVDEFIGKLIDVRANYGILYAIKGATPAALRRADNNQTPLLELRDVAELEALQAAALAAAAASKEPLPIPLAGFDADAWREIAAEALGFVKCPQAMCWNDDVLLDENEDGIATGICDRCGAFILQCPVDGCGEILAIDNGDVECQTCSAVWELVSTPDGFPIRVERVPVEEV